MVNIQGAIEHVRKNIQSMEEVMYDFEMITVPRIERDKEILQSMREQLVKMRVLEKKVQEGEELSAADIENIPGVFR